MHCTRKMIRNPYTLGMVLLAFLFIFPVPSPFPDVCRYQSLMAITKAHLASVHCGVDEPGGAFLTAFAAQMRAFEQTKAALVAVFK